MQHVATRASASCLRRVQPCSQIPTAVRRYTTSRPLLDARFDIFAKLKDPPGEADAGNKRKPSDRVIRLVDDILSLTLIEAADLCDLCQERLSPGEGTIIPGRMPFPHPGGMFAMPGMMGGGGMPMGGAAPAAPAAAAPAAPAEPAAQASAEPAAEKKPEAAKGPVSIKLVSFEATKKIGIIKEVRAITALGLKEAKDVVEGAPKIIKKGIPREEAEPIVEKLRKAGAVVEIE